MGEEFVVPFSANNDCCIRGPARVMTFRGWRIQLMPTQAPQPLTRPKNTYDKQAVARLEGFHAAALENGGTLPFEVIASGR
jgi:hypothetical protein